MLVLLLLLGSVTELAVWRARQDQQGHSSLEHTTVAVASLQHAYDHLFEGQAMLAAPVWAQDATLLDMYRETVAEVEQTLSVARVEALAEGDADRVAALDNLIERTGRLREEMELTVPTVLKVEPDEAVQTAMAAMPELWAEAAAIRVDLGRLLQEGEDELAAERAAADRAADITLWLMLGSGMAAFVAGSAAVIMLVRSVLRPLTSLRASVRAITSGDLEARAELSGPEEVASLARDFNEMVSERKRAEHQFARQSAAFQAINRVFEEVLRCESEEEVARTCLAVAEQLTGSRFGFIGEVNEAGRFDTIALSDPGWSACRMPRSDAAVMLGDMEIRGIWGRVIKDGRSQLVNDPACHADRVGTPDGHPPIATFLGVPLKHGGETIGMIAVANKESGYDLADQEDLESISVAFVEALMRKRVEEALRESEAKYRQIFENVQDIFYQTDASGIIIEISPSVERWAYTREELIGTQVLDVYESPEERSGLLKALLEHGEVSDYEVRLKTGDGWVVDASVSAHLLRGPDGRPVGVEGSLRDISERKRMEEALVQQAERERKLYQKQSEFVSTASHELRTPLHSIRGFTRLLLDGKVQDPETQREFLTIIDEQSGHLTALVRNLLDLARIEAGRMEMEKEPLALDQLVAKTVAEFEAMAQEKAITIKADLPPDLPVVEGDRERLGRVLTNLIGNAIKFSEAAGTITVRARVEGPELVVSVQDEGIGIPSKALPRLFERFYQVDSSSTRQQRGTGLGLYISKQIVEAHGGRIWVKSKVGEGSTFSFAVPVSVSATEDMRTGKAA